MSKNRTPYLILDEDILDDPKIEDLIEEKGLAGFGAYIGILTICRRYEDTDFMIPFAKISSISNKYLKISVKKAKEYIDYCVEVGLFEQFQNADGDRFFFSNRRKRDLFSQKELRVKQKKAAEDTNTKRYGNRYSGRSTEQ